MTLCEQKLKKNCKSELLQPLPLCKDRSGKVYRFKGEFNGLSVVINEEEDISRLASMGCFGKATLSRNHPEFQMYSPKIMRNRVFCNRKRHCGIDKKKICKVIVVPDSESESENVLEYFINLKPEYQFDFSGITEIMNLGLEEAFFLAASVSCLDVSYNGKLLELGQVWELFKLSDEHFVISYVAYYYFRSKNWIVKSGMKFGGDFLLYKQGPAFFHASYVVVVHVVDECLREIENLNKRTMKLSSLMGLNRLCETAGKELLICDVIWPCNLNYNQSCICFEDLSHFTVKETIMTRWISSKKKRGDQH